MTTRRQQQSVSTLHRQAAKSLARLRALVANRPSPFAGLSEEEAIERLRAAREQLWHHKLAARS